MTSATSGAVFFLGTRAHYQALQPPEVGLVDAENGNGPDNCSWIQCARSERSGSDMLLLEYHSDENLAAGTGGTGVTRRFRGRRAEDGSDERILTDRTEPVGLHGNNCRDSIKSKASVASGRCASLRALLNNLRSRRKRKLSSERAECGPRDVCTYRDSCRCLDCQSRYFECDESDGDCSVFSDNCNDYDYDDFEYAAAGYGREEPLAAVTVNFDSPPSTSRESEADEVFVDSPPDNSSLSAEQLIDDEKEKPKEKMSVSSDEATVTGDFENPLELEMAAGTPVFLDYLLNHPITCCVQ